MSDVLDAVREKYPAYKDVPDDQLAAALGQKYPVYLKRSTSFKQQYDRAVFPEQMGQGIIPGVGAPEETGSRPGPEMIPPRPPPPIEHIYLDQPVKLPRLPEQKTVAGQLLAGVANTAIDVAESTVNEPGFALAGAPGIGGAAVRRAIAATVIPQVPGMAVEAAKSLAKGDIQKAAEQATIPALVGLGVAAKIAPRTAEALAEVQGPPVTGEFLKTPRGAVPETPTVETVSPEQAATQAKAMTKEATAAYEAPKAPKPEVPATPPEPYETVLQAIRNAKADTTSKVQALFPAAQLSRQQAADLRRQAFGQEKPVPPAAEPIMDKLVEAVDKGDFNAVKKQAQKLAVFDEVPESVFKEPEPPVEPPKPPVEPPKVEAPPKPPEEPPAAPTAPPKLETPPVTEVGIFPVGTKVQYDVMGTTDSGTVTGIRGNVMSVKLDSGGTYEIPAGSFNVREAPKETPPEPAPAEAPPVATKPAVQVQVEKEHPPVAEQTKPPGLKPTQQKKLLFSEVDKAIKEAPEKTEYPKTAADDDLARIDQAEKESRPEGYGPTHYDLMGMKIEDLFEKHSIPETVDYLENNQRKTSKLGVSGRVDLLREKLQRDRWAAVPKITIDIPGDGTFEIANSKEALRAFKERAKSFPTTVPRAPEGGPKPAPKPAKAPPVEPEPTGESDLKAIAASKSQDPTRFVLQYTFSDGSHLVTTDGRRMTVIDRKGMGGTPKNPVALDEQGNIKTDWGVDEKGKPNPPPTIPNWNQVIPEKTESIFKGLDTEHVFTLLKQALSVFSKEDGTHSVQLYRDAEGRLGITAKTRNGDEYASGITETSKPVGFFDGNFLLDAMESSRRLGHKKVDIEQDVSGSLSPIVIKARGMKQIIMPMRGEGIEPPSVGPQPAPPPEIGPGPGAQTAGEPPKAQIEQLTDAFKGIQGKNVPLGDQVKQAFDVGGRVSAAKDAFGRALGGLKATGDYLVNLWKGATLDNLLRQKGKLSAELEKRGWRTREWAKVAAKQVPSVAERKAISCYIDAGGDRALLEAAAREVPENRRQPYQDALNLSPEARTAADNISNYFDARLHEAIDAGVLEEGLEDYIHRIYRNRPDLEQRAVAYVQSGILQTNPGLAKKRMFQFDFEAEKAGLNVEKDFIPRIVDYEVSLSKAIAARGFIKEASKITMPDGQPMLAQAGVGIPIESPEGVREATLIKPSGKLARNEDYVERPYAALKKWKWAANDADGKPIFIQGNLMVHKDAVGRIDALLKPSQVRYGRYGAFGRAAMAVSGTVKQTMLDLSFFHQVQLTVHALEHRVLPWKIMKDIDFENPNVEGLLRGGVTLGGEGYAGNYMEGLVGRSLTRSIPGLGQVMKSYQDWLFQSFIPRLKMTMALDALERNRKRYPKMPEEELHYLTAREANAAFGEQNYTMLERSKSFQDTARLILLAPDFLESRGRFAAQAFTKFGGEQRMALLLGAATMWTVARLINKATDDQYHFEPDNLFSVVHNGKAYGLRTVQGDVLHLLEKPLQFWMYRLNPLYTRTAIEALTGRDAYGRRRTLSDQAMDAIGTMVPIALRSSKEKGIWESLAQSMGVNARRWSDVDTAFNLAKKWKDTHGIQERGEFIYDPEKDKLRGLKVALSSGDEAAAVGEIKKLFESKTMTRAKLNAYFDRYASMPFTGSGSNDKKFIGSLSEDERKTVEAAKEHKKTIRNLYRRARDQYDAARATAQ